MPLQVRKLDEIAVDDSEESQPPAHHLIRRQRSQALEAYQQTRMTRAVLAFFSIGGTVFAWNIDHERKRFISRLIVL